jgi:hypothetical protein
VRWLWRLPACLNDVPGWNADKTRVLALEPYDCATGCELCAKPCKPQAISMPKRTVLLQRVENLGRWVPTQSYSKGEYTMSAQELADQAINTLTPERLRTIIESISQTQARDNRAGVSIGPIMDALMGGQGLFSGPGGWEAYPRLQQAVRRTVAQIEGMRYIEADA